MSDLCNLLNHIPLEDRDKMSKEQGIDIIDFQTVSYDKHRHPPKRSLSLNIYKYEQMLGLLESDGSSSQSSKTIQSLKKDASYHLEDSVKKMTVLSSFGLILSLCCFVLLAVIIYTVLQNGTRGKGPTY